MAKFKVTQTPLSGLLVIEPTVYSDDRGFFMESYNRDVFAEFGLTDLFVQDNHSRSKKGVLRGMHYQLNPYAMGKLVRVVKGVAFDVGVDIRKGSPTFGGWYGEVISDCNHKMLYLPPGFAHGYLALSDGVEFLYKCTGVYNAASERGLVWNDPAIGIRWPLEKIGQPILAERDASFPRLKDAETNFVY